MTSIELTPTRCAICGTTGNAEEVYPARLPVDAFGPRTFSARRAPDGIHYRIVRCAACGLVRSDPAATSDVLARVYAGSGFEYTSEVANLARTYGRELTRLQRFGVRKGSLLEIGCGNGFLLEEAVRRGFRDVRGIEPSEAAVASSREDVRRRIVRGMFGSGAFAPESFDVICLFQVLDHLPDPGAVLDSCSEMLRPGGLVLSVHHDFEAIPARLLAERSPIVDVEHTYLFSRQTTRRLFESRGFVVERVAAMWSRVSIRHVLHLSPVSGPGKRLLGRMPGVVLDRALFLPLGNVAVVGRRPLHASQGESRAGSSPR